VLVPGQWYDNESRASCPHTPRHKPHFAFAKTTTSVGLAATGASIEVTCRSRVDCFGTARLLRAASATSPRGRTGVLAVNGGFTIPAGQRATVTLALTRAGRALTKRARRPVKAKLKLTSVDPLGKATARSTAVTLKP
jgi:hypothetical protein